MMARNHPVRYRIVAPSPSLPSWPCSSRPLGELFPLADLDRLAPFQTAIMLNLFNFLNRYFAMKVVTYSHARNALKTVLDDVVRDADVAIISRRDAEGDAVVMSLDHYNSLMETLHLLSTPANAEALARAIRQDQTAQGQPRALLDADGA